MSTKPNDPFVEAEKALAAGDAQASARSLRQAARGEGLFADDPLLRRLLALAAGIGRAMGLEPLERTAREAAGFEPSALYEAGYELIDVGLPGVAIPVLQRVNGDLPGQAPVVSELAAALERCGRNREARDLLLEHPELLQNFWLRYLVCFNSIAAGDVGTARTHAAELQPDEAQPHTADATRNIRAMLRRADRLDGHSALDADDLRGWHYVLNGSVLLTLSPWGFQAGMRGRWAFVQDGVEVIRSSFEALGQVLDSWEAKPTCILALPERGSRIVAMALGKLWEGSVRGKDGSASRRLRHGRGLGDGARRQPVPPLGTGEHELLPAPGLQGAA